MKLRLLSVLVAPALLFQINAASAGVICEQGVVLNDVVTDLSFDWGGLSASWTEWDNIGTCSAPTGTLTTNGQSINTGVGDVITDAVSANSVSTGTISATTASISGTLTAGTVNATNATVSGTLAAGTVSANQVNANNLAVVNNITAGGTITASGGFDAGGSRIVNVAPGENDTDAVNMGQLNGLQGQVQDLTLESRRGIAGVTALAMIPDVPEGKDTVMGIGVGHFKGENAVALGANFRIPQTSAYVKLGASLSGGESTAGAGLGWSF